MINPETFVQWIQDALQINKTAAVNFAAKIIMVNPSAYYAWLAGKYNPRPQVIELMRRVHEDGVLKLKNTYTDYQSKKHN